MDDLSAGLGVHPSPACKVQTGLANFAAATPHGSDAWTSPQSGVGGLVVMGYRRQRLGPGEAVRASRSKGSSLTPEHHCAGEFRVCRATVIDSARQRETRPSRGCASPSET